MEIMKLNKVEIEEVVEDRPTKHHHWTLSDCSIPSFTQRRRLT